MIHIILSKSVKNEGGFLRVQFKHLPAEPSESKVSIIIFLITIVAYVETQRLDEFGEH